MKLAFQKEVNYHKDLLYKIKHQALIWILKELLEEVDYLSI